MRHASPVVGIGYQLWLRARWGLLDILVGNGIIVAGGAAFHLLGGSGSADFAIRLAIGIGYVLFSMGAILLTAAFTFTEPNTDLASVESGFPRHMFALPASNRQLAMVPMAFGALALAAAWVGTALLLRAVTRFSVPVAWPAAMMVAGLIWFQAIAWTPIWVPFGRVVLAGLLIGGLVPAAIACASRGMDPLLLAGLILVLAALAFPVAIRGVARGRISGGARPAWAGRLAVRRPRRVRAGIAFISAERAQLWFECRRNLPILVGMSGGSVLLIVGMSLLTRDLPHPPIAIDGHLIPPPILMLVTCLAIPFLIIMCMGGAFGKPDAWSSRLEMPTFLAARPMSSATFIKVKYQAAALTTLTAWVVVVAIVGLYSLVPRSFSREQSIAQWLSGFVTLREAFLALLVFLVAVFATWKQVAQSVWIFAYGRKWVAIMVPIAGIALLMGVGEWVLLALRHPPIALALKAAVPYLLLGLVVAKLLAAAIVVSALERRRLAARTDLVLLTAMWVGLATAVVTVGLSFRPHSVLSPLTFALLVILFLPAVRVAAAPLALHANRHR